VKLTLAGAGGHASFVISNNGPAIAPENQRRLFERFFRGDAAHGGRTEGFGLGLNIAHELARANGGTLELVESKDESTTFRLLVPLADAAR
jgi:signal transduction histidine kinase